MSTQSLVIEKSWFREILNEITHETVHAPVGICRECGRDVPCGHESMKCYVCRTRSEEWNDADLY